MILICPLYECHYFDNLNTEKYIYVISDPNTQFSGCSNLCADMLHFHEMPHLIFFLITATGLLVSGGISAPMNFFNCFNIAYSQPTK